MKRILFIIDSLTCGGAEKSLVSLLPLLDRSKYEVTLWIRHRGGVFESLLTADTQLVDAPRSAKPWLKPINYEEVNERLMKLRKKSWDFLESI